MATDDSSANEGVSAGGGMIHLILQGKGGVGKRVIASWLAEFLISRGRQVRCVDGDPVNRSLSQYKTLGAENLDLVNEDGLIQRWHYARLVERFLTSGDVFVVDSGATAFLPFWTDIVESEMIRVLRGRARDPANRERHRTGREAGPAPSAGSAGRAPTEDMLGRVRTTGLVR
jgi:hypothetical protein